MKQSNIVLGIAVLALAGCAIGNKHNYTQEPALAAAGARSVVVVAQDARPYVVSREKTPDFVGLQRGGFGNPFDVTTESGKPLADDFADAIARGLQSRGFKSTAVSVVPPAQAADPKVYSQRAGAERVALLRIHEWKSDTFMNTALHHDLVLVIYDDNGTQLATNRVAGNSNLGGDAINPPGHARGAVPDFYRKTLQQLFAPDDVVKSLR